MWQIINQVGYKVKQETTRDFEGRTQALTMDNYKTLSLVMKGFVEGLHEGQKGIINDSSG